ncbi:hypothetical protein CS0771_65460 [Catellatospora sp. IY07-71]|nr:hypothetical protein CS0771_65460 [Catellatospora sp. IY07-71]
MWTVVIGVAGTLLGVVLGSVLSARAQLQLQWQAHRQSELAARREAYAEYLSTLRRFRRFILHLPPDDISVVEGSGSPRGAIPLIKGADEYWDAVETARSRLWIVAGHDSDVRRASDAVMDALYVIAREQASHKAGALPAVIVDVSREAEQRFANVAWLDLNRGRIGGSERSRRPFALPW